jgi:hypothetical protein
VAGDEDEPLIPLNLLLNARTSCIQLFLDMVSGPNIAQQCCKGWEGAMVGGVKGGLWWGKGLGD